MESLLRKIDILVSVAAFFFKRVAKERTTQSKLLGWKYATLVTSQLVLVVGAIRE